MSRWFTGSGEQITFEEIIEIIIAHDAKNGKVSIGTDSFVKKENCTFSMAICLHNAVGQHGGRYFIKRTNFKKNNFPNLLQRILTETQNSVDLGIQLLQLIPQLSIEIHLDVSESGKGKKTSKFADMLTGYAKGAGFDYKIKPYAFAAQTVADKHSK